MNIVIFISDFDCLLREKFLNKLLLIKKHKPPFV